MAQKKTDELAEQPLPNAGAKLTNWTWRESEEIGAPPEMILRVPLEVLTAPPGVPSPTGTRRRRKTATFEVPGDPGDKPEIVPETKPGSWRKKGLPERTRKLLPLLLHEFTDLEGFDDKEIRYGSERTSGLMNVKIRLKRKARRPGSDGKGRSLASYPTLRRILPRLTSYSEEQECFRFTFLGWRPASVHVLGRVLETPYRFRLEDLSRFATHGDHLLHALEHVDSQPCLDPNAILYMPGLDAEYPFKFAISAAAVNDNYVVFVNLLQKVCEHTESVETFKDRFFGELKLGFEKFGPACATPQFQEVELRVWTLITFVSSQLQILVGDLIHTMEGAKIRDALKRVAALHQAIDDTAGLPGELAAFYRTNFDIPLANLFEHSIAALDEIAKSIGCNVKDRPRDIEYLTEMVTRFRRIEPTAPLEDMEAIDFSLAAAYANKQPVARKHPGWVRRYEETIFTGTDKFDVRRYKPLDPKSAGR